MCLHAGFLCSPQYTRSALARWHRRCWSIASRITQHTSDIPAQHVWWENWFTRPNQIDLRHQIGATIFDSVQSVVSYRLSADIDSKLSSHVIFHQFLVPVSVSWPRFQFLGFLVWHYSIMQDCTKLQTTKSYPQTTTAKLWLYIYSRYELTYSSITSAANRIVSGLESLNCFLLWWIAHH